MQHPFESLADAQRWKNRRDESMDMARSTRECLTKDSGYWAYQPSDERVALAVGVWVKRARDCHAIALGRRPVIGKMVIIENGMQASGALYARPTNPQTFADKGTPL